MKDQYKEFKDRPIAYFCAEYALFDHSPLYAGGLGILSGDYINEIIDAGLPTVAFGLFYHKNDEHGVSGVIENTSPVDLGLQIAKDLYGNDIELPLELNDRVIYAKVWQWKKSELTLFLLDTDTDKNNPADRSICDSLYVENRYERMIQEMVLGIGGMKVLEILKINPSVYHLNEGHSSFMAFELITKEMKVNGRNFDSAVECSRRHVVFTNHTLVPAGQEMYDIKMMESVLLPFAKNLNVRVDKLLNLGIDTSTGMFNMTNLALNISSKVNAVSALHGEKAREIWKGYNIESITNGIYLKRWDTLNYYSHKEQKKKLIELVEKTSGKKLDENTIIIGWARRFVEYKRPLAILGDIARLKGMKVQIVFSSALNTTYIDENIFVKELYRIMEGDLKDIVSFIPNYDAEIAKIMVSGSDVWLNTPIVGRESCGTSGMKACLNGTLPLSTRDGWIDEVDISEFGWIIDDNDNITKNILDVIEEKILPDYYNNKPLWNDKMDKSRKLIIDKFNTKRMLREYVSKLYRPISLKPYP
jgi:starch phosphorylase